MNTTKKEETNTLSITDSQKKAYKELTELCVFNEKSKNEILNFIETLKNYDDGRRLFIDIKFCY